MKRLVLWLSLAMTNAAPFGGAFGDDRGASPGALTGSWEGTLRVTAEIVLPIRLKVIEAKDGSLSGTWGSPDESLDDLPLASIAFRDDALAFTTKHGVTYKGKLDRATSRIVGEWTQRGKAYPLNFGRFDPSKVVAAPPIPGELEGIWEGKLKVGGVIELRLVLRVQPGKDGRLRASLVSPDQSPSSIPVNAIDLKDGELTFESKIIGAKYRGKKNEEGNGFDGHFTQSGMKLALALRKTDRMSEAVRPQTPRPPFPYRSQEVTYENRAGGVKLAGTLTLPPGPGPFPAVLMITGSGPQDRDETILAHRPFLVIADALARRGIAALRVDDRGVGGSTGSGSESTLDDLAGDALAGVAFLKGRREIDPARIGLIGHSEGGVIAPMAAARSTDVAFIVLMAGTGQVGIDILKAQAELILRAEGTPASEMKLARELQRRLIEIFVQEKDEKAARVKLAAAMKQMMAALPESEKKALREAGGEPTEAAVDPFNNAWFRSFLAYDPRPTLRKVRCPVLAINGEKDTQVPSKDNLAEIDRALKAGGNRDVKIIEFAGLNHLFQPCKTGSPSEYSRIETTIAPEVLRAIGDWIAARTPAR